MSNPNVPNKIYTPEKIEEIKQKLIEYINNNPIPIIAEFSYQNHINRQTLYELIDIKEIMQELICKKEANLEKGLLAGKLNASGAIFSLKQLGWRDNLDSKVNNTTEISFKNLPEFIKDEN